MRKITIIKGVILVMIAGCAVYVGKYYFDQHQVEQKNKEIATEVVIDIPEDSGTQTKKHAKIDISKMKAKYPNACGYLYAKKLLSYPVMQGEDNQFYLKHDCFGSYTTYGSLFFDANVTTNSRQLIIYGHNMINGSMFGNLDYYHDKDYFNKHQKCYLAVNDKTYTCELLLSSYTTGGSYLYQVNEDMLDIKNYIERAKMDAEHVSDKQINETDGTLLLSTCTSGNGRYVLLFIIRNISLDPEGKKLYEVENS